MQIINRRGVAGAVLQTPSVTHLVTGGEYLQNNFIIKPEILGQWSPPFVCHVSHVKCQVSGVICQVQVSGVTLFFLYV